MSASNTTSTEPISFDTGGPTSVRITVRAGEVEITASARSDTTVRVAPMNRTKNDDLEAAAQTTVEYQDGEVVIDLPDKQRAPWRQGAVRIDVSLPEGSSLRTSLASADLTVHGTLGDTEISTASGEVRLEKVGNVTLKGASGDLAMDSAAGDLSCSTASGDLRIGTVDGDARVNTASGEIQLGRVQGDLTTNTASGDVQVRAVGGSTSANTASGDLRIGSISRGSVQVKSVSGDVVIGVGESTSAWLELRSMSGDVRSRLDDSEGPTGNEETVAIRVKSVSGDITIRRAAT